MMLLELLLIMTLMQQKELRMLKSRNCDGLLYLCSILKNQNWLSQKQIVYVKIYAIITKLNKKLITDFSISDGKNSSRIDYFIVLNIFG